MAADQDRHFDGKVAVFKLNDGSQLQDISAHIISHRGLPGQFKMNDSTTWGSVGERPAPSIYVVHFTIEFLFNMITSTGSMTVLKGVFSNKALRAFEFYPAGTTAGNEKYSGSAYLPILEVVSQVGQFTQIHTEFHADNGVTLGTA